MRHVVSAVVLCAVVCLFVPPLVSQTSLAGENVNMVSGTDWTTGDPFLERQNEPSITVSTRNNLHLLAGNNDYRTVDLPGVTGIQVNGDTWLGVFKSFDGGLTWSSTLLPGYPQDSSAVGTMSPLHGFQAASDPTVRSGPSGLFYYSGISFNRTPANNPLGAVFVARFIDNNNRENGDPTAKASLTNVTPTDSIRYLGATVISSGTAGQFLDKPWLAVDIPRNTNTCTINFTNPNDTSGTQIVPAARVFMAWSNFTGTGGSSKVNIAYSDDCGATFSSSVKINQTNSVNQGTVIAIDPSIPATSLATVYIAWRRFANGGQNDAIVVAKSTDGGNSWNKALDVVDFPLSCATDSTAPGCQFDELEGSSTYRSNGYPALAVDATGRVYVGVSQRNANGDARIVLTMSTDGGNTWSAPAPIDSGYIFDGSGNPFLNLSDRGHQIMPSMSFNAGKLTLIYYDLRLDHTMGVFTPTSDAAGYAESRQFLADLSSNPGSVFTSFIDDSTLTVRRHTMDVQGAQADPPPAGQSIMPSFNTFRISKYFVGFDPATDQAEQLTYNPPDLPLFVKGTEPFMGDYIDLAGDPPFILEGGRWQFNTSNTNPQVFHATWTDNRDVVQPPNGDWTQYVPPYSFSNPTVSHPSVFDPTQTVPQCVAGTNDQYLGTRNQNIYTARIEPALTISSPGNQKALGYQPAPNNTQLLQRAFSMYARNATNAPLTIRLQTSQPAGGQASFQQFNGVVPTLDVTVAPLSTIARSVFAQSAVVTDSFTVQAFQITAIGGTPTPNGLNGTITFNPDPSAPQIINPDGLSHQDPSITQGEVYTPTIGPVFLTTPLTNSSVLSPYVQNPAIKTNYAIQNPAIKTNTDINPAIKTNSALNTALNDPAVYNSSVANALAQNQSLNDAVYSVTNTGNTAATYVVKLFNSDATLSNLPRPLCAGTVSPSCVYIQLLLSKQYLTNTNQGCNLAVENSFVTYTNVTPLFVTDPNQLGDPIIFDSDTSNATIALAPNETGFVILRTNLSSPELQQLVSAVAPVVVAHGANVGTTTPPATLAITSNSFPSGIAGQAYSAAVGVFGGKTPYNFTTPFGALPPGIQLNASTGSFSGSASNTGGYSFTVQVTDSSPIPNTFTRQFNINIYSQLQIGTTSLPTGIVGTAYAQSLPTTGGSGASYVWSATGLPAFLSIDPASGTISTPPGQTALPGTYSFSVTVNDPGPPTQTASQSLSVRFTENTTVTIAASPNPAMFGVPVTVAVTVVPGLSGTPTGPVSVKDATGATCTATLANGSGSCQLIPTALSGSDTVTASYPGDGLYNASSGTSTLAVNKGTTTLSLVLSAASAVVGQQVRANVMATPPAGVSISPTGSVTLSDGAGASCTLASLTATTQGQPSAGSCILVPISTGNRTIQATYAGDSSFLSSNGSASLGVTQASTSTTVSSPQTTAVAGQTITANFLVGANAPSMGTPVPTGTVTVSNSTGGSCTGSLAKGSGTCALTVANSGTSSLTGAYSGDSNYMGSNSPLTQGPIVGKSNTTTSASATPNPSLVGQPYTVNVTVGPAFSGIPTGQVAVSDGAGGSCGITLSSGKGSCQIASTTAGVRSLTASYGGDSNFIASVATVSQTVNIANSATAITSTSPNPSVLGQPVAVKFAVTAVAPGAGTPTGTVTLTASTGESCSNAVAFGSCLLTFTTAGSRTLTATYGGSTNFAASTSAAVTVTESVEDFTINASPTAQTIPSGHQGTFQIALTPIGGLTGNVNLTCSGAPTNSTCTISPSVINLSGSSSISTTVALNTAMNVNHGTFTLTFTGTLGSGNPATGGLTRKTNVSLTVK